MRLCGYHSETVWGSLGSHDCECTSGNIGDLISANIEIYPNPSNGVFHIDNIADVHSIKVNDILGKGILEIMNTKNNIIIELNEKEQSKREQKVTNLK